MRHALWITAAVFSLLVCQSLTSAQQEKNPKAEGGKPFAKPAAKRSNSRDPMLVTPAREAAAMTFARNNHPELAELLAQLKKANPKQHQRAVRELFQISERLVRIKERLPERYELALEAWKLDSRIRLLVARMTMSTNKKTEAELMETLKQRVEVRLREHTLERERLLERVGKLDKSISTIESDRDAAARSDLQRIKRSMGLTSPRKRKSKPGGAAKQSQPPKSSPRTTNKRSSRSKKDSKQNKK